MSLFKCILFITYIYIHTLEITKASKVGLQLSGTGLDPVPPHAVGLMFYVVVNNTSNEDYDIKLSPEQCCLKHNFDLDCDTMNIIGNSEENIPKGTMKTLNLVAPILNPYGRHGYCMITSSFKSKSGRNSMEKDTVKIDFNLQLDHKEQFTELPNYIKKCKNIDEDALNHCKPVNCDIYYNGKKPYYNRKRKRCTGTPKCISNYRSELPNTIYDPVSNACIHGRSIVDEDIEFIKSLEEPNNKKLYVDTHYLHLRNFTSTKLDDFLMAKEDPKYTKPTKNCVPQSIYGNFKLYFIKNKLTIVILFTVVSIQCCLICALGYYVTNKCDCLRRRKKVCNLFDYKTDASLTTPLIFSNTNTDTTDYQYLSESSNNIMRKINCYKSCQKERCNEIKLSISDDILSKCLTRRDWIDNKYTKSEATHGLSAIKTQLEDSKRTHDNTSSNFNHTSKIHTHVTDNTRKTCESKVVFKDEAPIKNEDVKKNIIKGNSINYTSSEDKIENEKKDSGSIEKEIRSHSYDCMDTNIDLDNNSSNNYFQVYNTNKPIKLKEAVSLSSNKGAQACFSKDSIDDFLSERGMMLLAGEDFSKYSFSCPSNPAKTLSSSEVSAKTSKNNIVRNMLTLLQKRSKQGISSDPGISTINKQHIDLELLHMSRASVFTTSNDSECVKEFTKAHDSSTSL